MTEIEELREENRKLKEEVVRLETTLNRVYEEKMMELKSQLKANQNRIYLNKLTDDMTRNIDQTTTEICMNMQQVKNNMLRSEQSIWEDRIRNRTERF